MDNMLDIDTDITSFQNELKRVKNELLELIPMDVKISFLEEEQELEFETYEEAEKTLELIQLPMQQPNARIVEV